jgi:hypothetical protein
MKRAIAIGSAMAIALCAVVTLAAQGKDFSGKWTADAPAAGAAAGGGGGGGRGGGGMGGGPMTIAMDAKTMTITRTTQAGESKTAYNLDGSDSKNPGRGGAGGAAPADVVSNAKWDGATLVITTKGANGAGDTTAKYSLDGAKLKVENTRPGRNGGDPTTTTTTYTKG